MGFPARTLLEGLLAAGPDLDKLAELDAAGHLIAPGEDFESYLKRLAETSDRLEELEKSIARPGGHEICSGVSISSEDRIPAPILAEAEAETERLYGFKIDWVPGFFLSKGVGLLWGGCAISFPGNGPSVFLIRSSFRTKARWFIYDRIELMAHELCHVARSPLWDRPLEEHFAYQTSKSALRRATGNCFQTQWDALLFIVPVFVLLGVQICKSLFNCAVPAWPFWILAGLGPAFLLLRNLIERRAVAKARKSLLEAGCERPEPLLFRCRFAEIKELSALRGEPLLIRLRELAEDKGSPRWAVILRRFMGDSFNAKRS